MHDSLLKHLIRQHLQAGGIRLPKRERAYTPFGSGLPKHYQLQTYPGEKTFSDYQAGKAPFKSKMVHGFVNLMTKEPSTAARVEKLGNLSMMDYRFWSGCTTKIAKFARCRACKQICHNHYERNQHKEYSKCTVLLTLAYKRLLKDHVCLICDTRTTRSKWGIPLCSTRCNEVFMFSLEIPEPLRQAILLERGNGFKFAYEVGK